MRNEEKQLSEARVKDLLAETMRQRKMAAQMHYKVDSGELRWFYDGATKAYVASIEKLTNLLKNIKELPSDEVPTAPETTTPYIDAGFMGAFTANNEAAAPIPTQPTTALLKPDDEYIPLPLGTQPDQTGLYLVEDKGYSEPVPCWACKGSDGSTLHVPKWTVAAFDIPIYKRRVLSEFKVVAQDDVSGSTVIKLPAGHAGKRFKVVELANA